MILAFDCDSSRLRAAKADVGHLPRPLHLDGQDIDLPLLVHWNGSTPSFGQKNLVACRFAPHQHVANFLPHLGEPTTWRPGKKPINAQHSFEAVLKNLTPLAQSAEDVYFALPAYLGRHQVELAQHLLEKLGWPAKAMVSRLLTLAHAGQEEQHWFSSALVVDLDDHALSLGFVRAVDDQIHLLDVRHFPHLGWIAWRERLLNALADSCVLQSRRDPRAYPWAEQSLFDQLPGLLDACRAGKMFQINLQGNAWYQNLILQPEQIVGFVGSLLRRTIAEIRSAWQQVGLESPNAVLLSDLTARVPGLKSLLSKSFEEWVQPVDGSKDDDDFGEHLMPDAEHPSTGVVVLEQDASLRALHALAEPLRNEAGWAWWDHSVPAASPPPRVLPVPDKRIRTMGRE